MQLTPTEEERLRVFTAAQLARATLAKGLRLNAPEAVALVCDEMHAAGRGGASFEEVAAAGRAAVGPDQVMDGVADIVPEIRVEVLLEEGTRLVVLREPFGPADGEGPGAIRFGEGDVELAPGPRPAPPPRHQPRRASDPRVVALPVLAHQRAPRVRSGRPPTGSGWTCPPATPCDGRRARPTRWTSSGTEGRGPSRVPERYSRAEHATRHGPTAGDRVRLGDTDLWIRIERDLTDPADQALWGYAKNWRSGMAQHDRATTESELDTIVASAVVLDPSLGVMKADIGIKDGRIAGIGRAGNPDITDGVDLTIGPNTWPIPCHGLIATRGRRRLPRAPALAAPHPRRTVRRRDDPHHRRVRGAARGGCSGPWRPSKACPVNIGLQPSARTGVPGTARGRDRGRRRRPEDPRGLGRLPRGDRRGAPRRRRPRHPGLSAHRRTERVVRAAGHRRGDRGAGDPRLPRGGFGRWPHPRPDRDRPRAERLLLLDHADDPLRTLDGRRAARHEADRPRGEPRAPRRRGRGPRARPSGHDGGRGTTARPRGDLDRELGLAGDGEDRRDRSPDVPARARDEGGGRPTGRTETAATTTSASFATWRR